ncbi:glycosyltransferase family 9 protein [Luteimonas kalidii]|uniref:Glycosyltransferase family 9 protein n=1 Tax=Luteimonas kalidii TaxID=3042025 RepID=A0ABT6JUJ7_9GAMM|nr:glycosyltransferase family 9 protein [Luteimonas kalidii]MDH5834254.1 glycosyltransferase family 9 protein [Luteimonas kalidii]
MSARPLIVRCGAFGDMVMLTTLMRVVSARYDSPVDVVSSGGWTPPLLQREPTLGHLQMVTSRKTPYLLCPSQWALVRWLRARGRGPVYLGDTDPEMRALLVRGGVQKDDIVARDPAGEDAPVLWPDRWIEIGMRDPATPYPVREVDPAPFRLPRLVVREDERREAATWLAASGLTGPLVLLQPGNKRTHKRGRLMTADHPKHWDAAHWAAVARAALADLPDAHVLLCGSPPEHPLLEDIRTAAGHDPRIVNGANDLPIPRLLPLLERAHSMVSVDTGPAHAAAALGCPLVVLFGAAPPDKWRPIGPGPIRVLGGERGADSRVADLAPGAVIAAWRSLPGRA